MGFCTKAEYKLFLKQAPVFEKLLVNDGILLYKYWLAVDQVTRRSASPSAQPIRSSDGSSRLIDLEAREHYVEYGRARDAMFDATHTKHAPWYVVDFNDQRRGRLNLIRHLLDHVPDRSVPETKVELPPLGAKPRRERVQRARAADSRSLLAVASWRGVKSTREKLLS